jgi:hypothetical protein
MLNSLGLCHRRLAPAVIEAATGLTRGRFIGSALFNPLVLFVVHRQSPSHGLKTPVDRFRDATR